MRQRLTDVAIRQLPHPESGNQKIWDTQMPGFGIRVTSGRKSFIVMYGNDRQLKTIGKYPEVSLKEARAEARKLLALKPEKTINLRLHALASAYLRDCEPRLRPSSYRRFAGILRRVPDIPLDQVSKQLAETAHEIAAYKAMFNWAIREELTDRNPFTHVTASYNKRERVLSDEELNTIWAYEHPPYSTIVKLLILTGQRLNQIASLQSDWIEGDLIHFPAAVMKNGDPHTIPIGQLSHGFLSECPFGFSGWSNAKKRMDRLTGVEGYRLHDLRRTWATKMAEIGTPIQVAEAHLDHRSGTISGVAAIYFRHNWLAEMRDAVQRYEDHILQIVGGNYDPRVQNST